MKFGKILFGIVLAIVGVVGLCYVIALDINYVCANWTVDKVWELTVVIASIVGTFIASLVCISISSVGCFFVYDGIADGRVLL